MAAAIPGIVNIQENYTEGHGTRFSGTFFGGGLLPFDLEWSFRFICLETPTSWSLRLAFSRVPTDGSVSCDVTIRRLDNAPVAMGTDFWMKVILPYPMAEYTTLNLRTEGMFPNQHRSGIIQFMTNEVLMCVGSVPVQVGKYFRIRRCHRDILVDGPVYSERLRPPEASVEMDIVLN